MIKKIKKVKTFTDKFQLPVDLLHLSPQLENVEYLLGGFYNTKGYSMYAFYKSDENGNILDLQPFLQDEGINTYGDIFEKIGYVYI